jgi:hypothetical protein
MDVLKKVQYEFCQTEMKAKYNIDARKNGKAQGW